MNAGRFVLFAVIGFCAFMTLGFWIIPIAAIYGAIALVRERAEGR